jgi:myo-inositol-1(or 4)-monophosphatase
MDSSLAANALNVIKGTHSISFPHWGIAAKTQKTSHHDVVTQLDKDVETHLREEFKKLDPSIDFVGEEFGGDRSRRHWLCDPIDGTLAFVRGLPFCTTMVSLIEDGEVVFAAIYDFVRDEMYHAQKGSGAFCNDTRIAVSTRPVEESCIAYETRFEKNNNMERFLRMQEKTIFLKTLTAGYESILVASGKIEGRVGFDPYGNDYDFAPGSLLVTEAGGIVSNLGKLPYDYRDTNHIMATPALHEWLTGGPDATFPAK